jgi:hypothetical protein
MARDLRMDYKRKNSFIRRWAAVFILLAFFIGSWAGQYGTQLSVAKQEAQMHNQDFSMSEFWPEFWQSTFENWQSEWLQLLTQALLIAGLAEYLFRKENEEHYKTQLMIEKLEKQINAKKS